MQIAILSCIISHEREKKCLPFQIHLPSKTCGFAPWLHHRRGQGPDEELQVRFKLSTFTLFSSADSILFRVDGLHLLRESIDNEWECHLSGVSISPSRKIYPRTRRNQRRSERQRRFTILEIWKWDFFGCSKYNIKGNSNILKQWNIWGLVRRFQF